VPNIQENPDLTCAGDSCGTLLAACRKSCPKGRTQLAWAKSKGPPTRVVNWQFPHLKDSLCYM